MGNISIASAIAPQAPNAGGGVEMAALLGAEMADAGGQFGMLLTQQLQQILAQGAVALTPSGARPETAPDVNAVLSGKDVDAAILADVSEQLQRADLQQETLSAAQLLQAAQLATQGSGTADSEVEEKLGNVLVVQAGQSVINPFKVARGVGKADELAEKDGKKLPQDLPVESKIGINPVADERALASMVAAQVGPQVQSLASQSGASNQSGASKVETPIIAKDRLALVNGASGQDVSLRAEFHAVTSSDVPVVSQPASQPFAALMTERTASNTNPGATPTLEIPHRVDSAQWGSGLADKVVWMVGSQNQGAELRLNPPSLGPLEVRVSMNDGQATLSFMTSHAPVREAIEAATPRLREMLADSGINLGSVSVNVGTFSQQQPGAQEQSRQNASAGHWSTNFDEDDGGEGLSASVATSVQYLRDGGMVDLFA